jgi:hypothetical protein
MEAKSLLDVKGQHLEQLQMQYQKVAGQVDGYKTAVKKAELKVRQMTEGKVKTLNRQVREQAREILQLKNKISGLSILQSANNTPGRSGYSKIRQRFDSMPIDEANEQFEASGSQAMEGVADAFNDDKMYDRRAGALSPNTPRHGRDGSLLPDINSRNGRHL